LDSNRRFHCGSATDIVDPPHLSRQGNRRRNGNTKVEHIARLGNGFPISSLISCSLAQLSTPREDAAILPKKTNDAKAQRALSNAPTSCHRRKLQ